MLNLNNHTKTKRKPKNQQSTINAHLCAQLSDTTQHRTVLTISALILQTIVIARMMSTGGEGAPSSALLVFDRLVLNKS